MTPQTLPGIAEDRPRYELRPYQQHAADAAVRFLTERKRGNGIEVLPTGSGKSLVIANIARALGEPTLIFQPSREILDQNYRKMLSYGEQASIYSASKGRREVSALTFATIGSVKSRAELFRDFRYILIDECHLVNPKQGIYKTFLEQIDDARVLGFTATPYRLASNSWGSELRFLTRTRPRIFEHLVYFIQNGELFRQGYLSPLRYVSAGSFNRLALQFNSTGAEYDDGSVRRHMARIGFPDLIVQEVKSVMNTRRNALIFTQSVDDARYVANNVPDVAVVSAETSTRERDRIGEGFKSGRIWGVANVGVYAVGFDYPALETVIQGRPTLSLAVHYQQIGRLSRPHPEKVYGLVIDMVGNVGQFGRMEDLALRDTGNQKWVVESKGRQLTNIYYGEKRGERR